MNSLANQLGLLPPPPQTVWEVEEPRQKDLPGNPTMFQEGWDRSSKKLSSLQVRTPAFCLQPFNWLSDDIVLRSSDSGDR